jgi:hypothetical protein
VLMNAINCFSILKLASGKCFLVYVMCFSFIAIFISKRDVHIGFLHHRLFIDHV